MTRGIFTTFLWSSLLVGSAGRAAVNPHQGLELSATIEAVDLTQAETEQVQHTYEQIDRSTVAGEPDMGPHPLDIDRLITLGERLYKIVEAGRPVLNAQEKVWSVIPAGLQNWSQLERWNSRPLATAYAVTLTNKFGIDVVKLRYVVSGYFGGQYSGHGRFLSNVLVLPTEVDVAWGYSVAVEAESFQPMNTGTKDDPVALLPFRVRFTVETPIKKTILAQGYHFSGDGQLRLTSAP